MVEWPQRKNWSTNEYEDEKFSEVELDSIPTSLYECPVCGALVSNCWGSDDKHKAWHLGKKDSPE